MSSRLPFEEFVGLVRTAMSAGGYPVESGMHPEDWVANMVPVMEAVAVGWTAGYRERAKEYPQRWHAPEEDSSG